LVRPLDLDFLGARLFGSKSAVDGLGFPLERPLDFLGFSFPESNIFNHLRRHFLAFVTAKPLASSSLRPSSPRGRGFGADRAISMS